MRHQRKRALRVLAIHPCPKGFGFAVMEGPEHLIDFGTGIVKGGKGKNLQTLRKIAVLMDRRQPDIIVIEDFQREDYQCGLRAKNLLQDVVSLASEKRVKSRTVARRLVKRIFPDVRATRRQVVTELAKEFPKLEPYTPYVRGHWITRDIRAAIFDAVALALIFFSSQTRNTKGRLTNHSTEL